MLTAAALHRHGLNDQTLTGAYKRLFGFDAPLLPAGPGAEDTEERQRVRRRVWEEARPYLTGEMLGKGSAVSTPLPGMR